MTQERGDERRGALRRAAALRWGIAGGSFASVVVLFLMMDFGNRGYHFEPERRYASNVVPAGSTRYDLSRLRLLTRCLGYIRANYVDPSRADARGMVVAALDEVERRVPELLADPVTARGGEVTGLRIRVAGVERTFDLSRVVDTYTMNWKLLDIFEFVTPLLSASIPAREVEYAAVNGMLKTLDPHSVLLTPAIYREMKLGTTGKFGGLGIVIGSQDGHLTVQSVLDETPADRAGLKSGDQIVQIGAESTINMSLRQAVKRLRGPPGTAVTIWILRKAFKEPRRFKIVRSHITLRSVTSRALDGGLGYVRVKNFQEATSDDLAKSVERLASERRAAGGALRGLILDLRDNPGGLLDQAVKVSDLFLSDGTIVTTVGSGDKVREEKVATASGTWADLPLAVLVNSGSASASEIVAGAFRNNDRAVIVGATTFGKGSVQVIYDIDEAALKLTVAQYLTPGDESIQSVGITPHVELVPVTISAEHIDLNVTRRGGESRLANHLKNRARIKVHAPDAHLVHLADEEEDFALTLAERMLLEAGRPTARATLQRSRPIFRLAESEQSRRIAAALGKLDVDWNDGRNPKRVALRARLVTDRPRGRVRAGDPLTVKLEVTNAGTEPVYRVHAHTRSDFGLLDGRDLVLGRIPPGETRTRSLTVQVPRYAPTRQVPLVAEILLGDTADPAPGADVARTDVEVRGRPRPRFGYAIQVLDPEGNGDGLLGEREAVTLLVRVENVGAGTSQKTVASLKNAGGEEVFITRGRARLEELEPGRSKVARFELELRDAVPDDGLKLDLIIHDTVLRQKMVHRIAIPLAGAGDGGPVAAAAGRWATGPGRTAVRAGASADAPALGDLPEGSAFRVDGRKGRWLRVPLEPEGQGWIADSGLVALGPEQRVSQRLALAARLQVEQPLIQLAAAPPAAVDAASIAVDGTASFPWTTAEEPPDVYIFRGPDKVFFQRKPAAASGDLTFHAEIPLESGLNQITVYARSGQQLFTTQTIEVFRRR